MKTPKQILERRRCVRLVEALPFKIGHQGYEIEAMTVNISSHGAMCLVDRDIPLMTQLKVAMILSGSGAAKSVHATGVVVRKDPNPDSDKFFVAVYFSSIKPADQKTLNHYIEQRLKRNL